MRLKLARFSFLSFAATVTLSSSASADSYSSSAKPLAQINLTEAQFNAVRDMLATQRVSLEPNSGATGHSTGDLKSLVSSGNPPQQVRFLRASMRDNRVVFSSDQSPLALLGQGPGRAAVEIQTRDNGEIVVTSALQVSDPPNDRFQVRSSVIRANGRMVDEFVCEHRLGESQPACLYTDDLFCGVVFDESKKAAEKFAPNRFKIEKNGALSEMGPSFVNLINECLNGAPQGVDCKGLTADFRRIFENGQGKLFRGESEPERADPTMRGTQRKFHAEAALQLMNASDTQRGPIFAERKLLNGGIVFAPSPFGRNGWLLSSLRSSPAFWMNDQAILAELNSIAAAFSSTDKGDVPLKRAALYAKWVDSCVSWDEARRSTRGNVHAPEPEPLASPNVPPTRQPVKTRSSPRAR